MFKRRLGLGKVPCETLVNAKMACSDSGAPARFRQNALLGRHAATVWLSPMDVLGMQ